MVTHSYYETDNRVMRYASTLAERGDSVDVFSLRRKLGDRDAETLSGVNVFRIQDRPAKNERSQLSYLWPVARFLWTASRKLSRRHRQSHYDLVHVHNVPDFLVFAAWRARLSGAKVILDIHDIVPEFYASKFSAPMGSLAIRSLKWLERISASYADHIIIANHLWLDKYTARSAPAAKVSVFINHVDAKIFQPRPRTRQDNRLIVMFPGGLQWHQGLDIAIRAFGKVTEALPTAQLHIYGDGNMKPSLVALATDLGLNGQVQFHDAVPVHTVAALMSDADLGVVPKRADSFGNEAYSTKIMEFLSLGVPVVVSNTKIDRFYFDDSVVKFFESGNETALAEAILVALQDQALRSILIRNGFSYVSQNSWETRKHDYLKLVDDLCAGQTPSPGPDTAGSMISDR